MLWSPWGADKSLARTTSPMSKDGIDSVVWKTGLFMCRIATLFLLQRLKGSMSGDAPDFNNIETQVVIKFFFLQGKAPKEIHAILKETLGEHAPSYATVKNWVTQFKRGDFSTCDAHRPGRTKTVTTPEIIDQIVRTAISSASYKIFPLNNFNKCLYSDKSKMKWN